MWVTLTLTDVDCTQEPWVRRFHRPEVKNIDDANDFAIYWVAWRNRTVAFSPNVRLVTVEVEETK